MDLQMWLRRGVPLIGVALVVALMTAVGGAGAIRDNGVRAGHPWTGAAGIQRTTRQIMQQARRHHATRAVREFDAPLNLHRNPNAPSSDKTVASVAAASPRLAVGTSFTGGTLAE